MAVFPRQVPVPRGPFHSDDSDIQSVGQTLTTLPVESGPVVAAGTTCLLEAVAVAVAVAAAAAVAAAVAAAAA